MQQGTDPYLDAIESFFQQYGHAGFFIKRDEIKTTVITQTKVLISEAVDPMKSELLLLQNRVAALEQAPASAQGDEVFGKIGEMEKFIEAIKIAGPEANDNRVAVVGGLKEAGSSREAEQWLRSQMATLKVTS